mgnify:CR=1 FL=1
MLDRVYSVLEEMDIGEWVSVAPVLREEDGSFYDVWTVTTTVETYILKKAKEREYAVYTDLLKEAPSGAPKLLTALRFMEEDYLLLEYVRGENLCKCDRERLKLVLEALIALQEHFWGKTEFDGVAVPFEESLAHRKNRGKYLNDGEIEKAYADFLQQYPNLPRTLCHDDLLPFNVIAGEQDAKLIDWESAGILPYPVSLARLIAHGEEKADAFFFMTEADRQFAIDYYYDRLIRSKGIGYADYRKALDGCLLYEYCEWIMLGVKYPEGDMTRYRQYLRKAKEHIKSMI